MTAFAKIPSTFQRFDDSNSNTDQFLNVRDLHVLRANHNKLIAARHMQTVLSIQGTNTTNRKIDGVPGPGTLVYDGPVLLHPLTQSLTAYAAWGTSASASTDTSLYFSLHAMTVPKHFDSTLRLRMNTGTAAGTGTLTIPVPPQKQDAKAFGRHRMMNLRVWLLSTINGTPVGTFNVNASDQFGIDVDDPGTLLTGGGAANDRSVVSATDTDFAQRQMRSVVASALGGTNVRIEFTRPPSKVLVPGTDTVTISDLYSHDIRDIVVYEDEISDFDNAGSSL